MNHIDKCSILVNKLKAASSFNKYNCNFSYMTFNTLDKQRELYVENH